MAMHRWSFSKAARARSRLASARRLVVLLAVGATVLAIVTPDATRAAQADGAWPAGARSMAGTVASHWAANVPATARLGAEPPGHCRRLDSEHAGCRIAIAVLANGDVGRRPWRCSATVMVSRAGDRLAGWRTHTRCTPFPPPSAVPDPAAALGTAVALHANGDIACLPAGSARVTCVMSYAAPTGQPCMGAASVPLSRPARSVALASQAPMSRGDGSSCWSAPRTKSPP
jgi:hypothetical protein